VDVKLHGLKVKKLNLGSYPMIELFFYVEQMLHRFTVLNPSIVFHLILNALISIALCILSIRGTLFSSFDASIHYFIIKVIFMKSIVFISFLAIAALGCHSPEKSTGSDMSTSPTMSSDSSTRSTPSTTTDTVATTPVDTTGTKPMRSDTTTTK
jgi:hypothetical protein